MGLEYIVQPQIFLGGLTALGPGIQGLTKQYPLLTTYYSWVSTGIEDTNVFPIPIELGSIYEGPGKEASFVISVGGVIQSPTEYTIDTTLRTITFNSTVSADIEVAITQLATASPSSQSFDFVESVRAEINSLTSNSIEVDSLLVTNLTALSSVLQVTDIQIYEIEGFTVDGDFVINGSLTTPLIQATEANIISLSSDSGVINLQELYSANGQIDNLFVTELSTGVSVIDNLTAVDSEIDLALINTGIVQNLTAENIIVNSGSVIVETLTAENAFIQDLTGTNIVATNNFYGNLSGSLQIQNVEIETDQLRNYFTLKAAVDRCLRTIFVVTSGSGYTSAPQVVIDPPTESWGKQAHAVAFIENDNVSRIEVTYTGLGYTKKPKVTLVGGGGSDATAVALVDGSPLGEDIENVGMQAGQNNTTILGNDGNLYAWGNNSTTSNIGGGVVDINYSFFPVPFNTTFALSANISPTYKPRVVKYWRNPRNLYVLDQNGWLWSCGANEQGQLGVSDTVTKRTLTRINPAFFDDKPIIDFAVNEGNSGTTCLAVNINNDLFGWGLATSGGVPINNTAVNVITPVKIISNTINTNVSLSGIGVDQIYCFGGIATATTLVFVVLKNGLVYAAGTNTTAGQLGIGSATVTIPTLSSVSQGPNALSGINFITSAGTSNGTRSTYFLNNDGVVYSTGFNISYELGYGTNTATGANSVSAVLIPEKIDLVRCSGGLYTATVNTSNTVYAVTQSGNIYTWGTNSVGQCGLGSTTNIQTPTIVLSAQNDSSAPDNQLGSRYRLTDGGNGITWGPGSIANIAASNTSAAILRKDGKVFVAGFNTTARIGTGDQENKTIFTKIPDFPLPVQYLAFGAAEVYGSITTHLIAVLNDGSVYITGKNNQRQVKDSGITQYPRFIPVCFGEPLQAI